jgi:hypothetical protein
MSDRSFAPILLAGLTATAFAQPVLLPSIGIGALPADSEPICTLPVQTPPINTCGRPEGEQAAGFTLYDIDGNAFDLEATLLLGKPVLMIGASYTCPVFRNKLPRINQVAAAYASQLTTIIVYTVEAHPHLDISPYFGAVNTHQANIQAGILYEQPETYGERKAVVQDMLDSLTIQVPVYIDGPCNNWWNYYGPQPNNAYLIGTNGIIHTHHDWFDKHPEDIDCDIEDLLGLPITCGNGGFGGSFAVQLISNDTILGDAGTTLTGHALLTNATNADCLVRIVKLQVSLPAGWQTSLCADVCYLPDVDTAIVQLAANSTMDFYYYFYTTSTGTGYTRVGFRNENDHSNAFIRNFWAVASEANAIAETDGASPWSVLPNPASDRISLHSGTPFDGLLIMDLAGRETLRSAGVAVDIAALASGVYLAQPMRRGAPVAPPIRFVKE